MRSVIAISNLVAAGAVFALSIALPARADDQPGPPAAAPAAAPEAPKPPVVWTDALKLSGYVEGGFTGNVDSPKDGLNIGHLFTDKSNEFLLNQASIIFERPVDTSGGYDFGFRFQGLIGSDARYTHFLGECDICGVGRTQVDVVEAHADAHLPVLTAGGMDVKLGQFVTLLGAETIDPRTNYLYSHSYIFNYGLPLKDTGLMVVTHVSPLIDLYTGVITGVNTSIGDPGPGDNNGALAFEGGIGLNISDSLTVLATTNIGPENPCAPAGVAAGCNSAFRWYGDVVVTWKISDALTSITEANIVRDDGPADFVGTSRVHPTAGGIAQYLVYNLTDVFALVGRAELFRDANGYFVGAFPYNNDFVNLEEGHCGSCGFLPSPQPTTYGEITAGLNIKPPVPDFFKGAVIRPEIRFDDALSGGKPFDGNGVYVGKSNHQITMAVDAILPF